KFGTVSVMGLGLGQISSLGFRQVDTSANSWQGDLHSSGSGKTLHWQWELILPVGTLSWQWEFLVHFIPNTDFMNSSDSVVGIVSRCSSPMLRESTGSIGVIATHGGRTEADNHNQNVNCFHMYHPSKSRMWGVEDGRSREGNRKNSDDDHKRMNYLNYITDNFHFVDQFYTARTYTIGKGVCWGRWWRRVVGSSGLWWNRQRKRRVVLQNWPFELQFRDDEKDDEEEGGDDEQEYDEEEFLHAEEEPRDEESFDLIPKTPKDTDDEGNGEEDLGLNVGREEVHDEEEDKLYRDQSSSVSSQFMTSMLNLTLDAGMESIFKTTSQMDVKEKVKVQVSKILPKIEQTVNELLEAEVLTRSSNSSKTSYAVAADLSEMELKKILIEKMEGNKSIHRSNEQRNLYKALVEAHESDKIILDTYGDTITLKRRRDDDADKDEEPSAGPDRGESAAADEPMQTTFEMEEPGHPEFGTGADNQPIVESIQTWISELMKQSDSRSSFNELMDTPVDFSNILINRIKVDTLTLELLVGPTYELLKGSCKSLVELEYQLEEVYKATTNQLDWVNPKGTSSHKYTTFVTKTKAADYGHIKWIEDLVPSTMWIHEPIGYDKHALWGVSHWGHKRHYGFAVNQESTRDVYSKRRIIAVTELKIVEWHNYKHLDWITVRIDDDKLYKFKEGNFKRLRIQDIEDMLLLFVQGKLTNLTVEERFAFNVSLRMYTRSIVIQRHVEDLQLGVESYQKKLNLTKPDTYHSDLKRKEAYIAYSNQRGFIYQNKDKKNKLMRIDELHKFCDGTLIDICTALDDRLKGIRM
nr:hypothetical protein [Tanacetum cinerariifolium]